MNQKVDLYLEDGCGRCKYYKTPQCKVHDWLEELKALRELALASGLVEELKWSFPVYTYQGKNIIMIAAFKEYTALSFFKGALLHDNAKILHSHGDNSQAVRILKFTDANQIYENKDTIKSYIYEAIEIEKAGLKIEFKKEPEPMPAELKIKIETDPELKKAFNTLTPGRQRAYILYFSQPKQAATRETRIQKCIPKIMNGEGLNDNYKC